MNKRQLKNKLAKAKQQAKGWKNNYQYGQKISQKLNEYATGGKERLGIIQIEGGFLCSDRDRSGNHKSHIQYLATPQEVADWVVKQLTLSVLTR